MPAKNLFRTSEERTYSHVYNRGIEQRVIFSDAEDYETFQGFLKDYLTTPARPESTKRSFTVKGRIYRGVPHQPKNYFNQVELIAYSLVPDHFHLILHQKVHGSIESLIRSLCTRYSMYFNKKYQRTGSLFEGPYKSVQIKDPSQLSPLTRYIHHGQNDYSSYPEYSDKKHTSWVNTNSVPSSKKSDNDNHDKDRELLDGITLDNGSDEYLERRDLTEEVGSAKGARKRTPEIASLLALYLILTGLGLRNINISASKNIADSSVNAPTVLSESAQPTGSSQPKTLTTVVAKIPEGMEFTNIRREPTIDSPVILEAKDGDRFEFVSVDSGWYQVKLKEGSTGFIRAEYTYLEDTQN